MVFFNFTDPEWHYQPSEFRENTNYAGYSNDILNQTAPFEEGQVGGVDTVWLLLTSFLIFFWQLGSVLVVNGKQGNYGNFALKTLINFTIGGIMWYLTGYAFTYGKSEDTKSRNAFIGNFNFALKDYRAPEHTGPFFGLPFWIHGFAYAMTANQIIGAGIGGRGTVLVHILSTMYVIGFAYPVVAHWVLSDNGWLSPIRLGTKKDDKVIGAVGAVDFAAAGPVHVFGGAAAFAASLFSRKAEVPKTEDADLITIGTFLNLFAAYGYIVSAAINPDFESMQNPDGGIPEHHYAMAAGRGAINLTMSVAGSLLFVLFLEAIVAKEFNLTHATNAINVAFAAISSNCLTCEPWAALIAGVVAGLLYFAGRRGCAFLNDNDTFATHGLGGIWGCFFTGLLAKPQLLRHLLVDSWYDGIGAQPTGFNATTGLFTFKGADKPYNPHYSVFHGGIFYPKKNVHGKLFAMMILEATVIFAWGFCMTLPLYAIMWAVGQMTIKNAEAGKADA
jgi:Amt family ammonium transporter